MHRPVLGQVEFEGSFENNILGSGPKGATGALSRAAGTATLPATLDYRW